MNKTNVFAICTVLYFAVVTATVLQWRAFPENAGSASPTDFSAERAATHVRTIAATPHPVGVPAHDEVANYIIDQIRRCGYEPLVQDATEIFPRAMRNYGIAYLKNIAVRIPGNHNSKAVLVVSHYDSVRNSPGAADDGAAVAAMLEMIRAVAAGNRVKNDIIFLFTDGEELGLLGAKAFVEQNALASQVGTVLNFDARGSSGPSIMFETSRNNGELILRYAKAAPYPYASSLTQALYSLLSNSTDFSVFRQRGYAGLNFAVAEDWSTYHSVLDTSDRLDLRSLQHHGSNGLSLVREFGNSEPPQANSGDFIYFNIPGMLVRYPGGWSIAFSVLITGLFITIAVYGLRKRHISGRGVSLGLLFAITAVIAVCAITWLLNQVILRASPAYKNEADIRGFNLWMVGLSLTGVSIFVLFYRWFSKRVSGINLSMGFLVIWLVLLWITCLRLPGASYVFLWPMLFGGVSTAAAMRKSSGFSATGAVVLCLLATLIIMVALPAIQLMSVALTLPGAFVVASFVALLMGVLLPQVELVESLAPSHFSVITLTGAGMALLISGMVVSNTHARFKTTNHILYIQNFDKRTSFWMTENAPPDEWTGQFFSAGLKETEINNYLPAWYSPVNASSALVTQAPSTDLSEPSVSVVADNETSGDRELSLRVQSSGHAPIMIVRIDSKDPLTKAEVNGRDLSSVATGDFSSNTASQVPARTQKLVIVRFYGVPEQGSVVTVHTGAKAQVAVSVVEIYFDIPAGLKTKIQPRAPTMMPSRNGGDGAIATRTFNF